MNCAVCEAAKFAFPRVFWASVLLYVVYIVPSQYALNSLPHFLPSHPLLPPRSRPYQLFKLLV